MDCKKTERSKPLDKHLRVLINFYILNFNPAKKKFFMCKVAKKKPKQNISDFKA